MRECEGRDPSSVPRRQSLKTQRDQRHFHSSRGRRESTPSVISPPVRVRDPSVCRRHREGFFCCHSEERSDEESTISLRPCRGGRHRDRSRRHKPHRGIPLKITPVQPPVGATLVVAPSRRQPFFIPLCDLRKAMVILRSAATKNLQSHPRRGERHREGFFAIQLTKTEQLP